MPALALSGLNHGSFPVRDLDHAVRFYQEVLGLTRSGGRTCRFPGPGSAAAAFSSCPPRGSLTALAEDSRHSAQSALSLKIVVVWALAGALYTASQQRPSLLRSWTRIG